MQLIEKFLQPSVPRNFHWLNEPTRFKVGQGLEIYTDAQSDFWQRTHYGFQRDTGHCLLTRHSGDFTLLTHVEFSPRAQYDQCGLMVRGDQEHWIKVSTEFENAQTSRLGSVVTNLGYSDWATQDISSSQREMWYRINKNADDFLLEHSYDGQHWPQLRITHLHKTFEQLEIGVYACSPTSKDYWCRFTLLSIAKNEWQAPVS